LLEGALVSDEAELEPVLELVPPGEAGLPWLVLVVLLLVPTLVPLWSLELPVPPSFWLQPTRASAAQKVSIVFFIVDSIDFYIVCQFTVSVSIHVSRPKDWNNSVKPRFQVRENLLWP
jgi:hypothetical protein